VVDECVSRCYRSSRGKEFWASSHFEIELTIVSLNLRKSASSPAPVKKSRSIRNRDVMYMLVSFFLGVAFLIVASISLTAGSTWEFWEGIPVLILSLVFFGFSIMGVKDMLRGEIGGEEGSTQSMEIVKMIVLVIALIIAVLVMFWFGFG